MTIANDQHEAEEGEAPIWAWPLYALLALIASIFDHITKLKRVRPTTKFKPDWRDSWPDLRQGEWLRDQVIAHGLASLLAGKDLDLNAPLIMDPPDDYGGPCPRTPFQMNQRFLALAKWTTNPEAIIRERYKRIVKRLGVNNPLASHGSTDAALRAAAHNELVGVATPKTTEAKIALILSSARSARPSKDERVLANARGPPLLPVPACLFPNASARTAPETAPARPQPRTSLAAPRSAARARLRPRRTSRAW